MSGLSNGSGVDTQAPDTQLFSWELQHAFARASADYNPMHVDAVAARRTQAGVPVVHGIHLLCGYLEHLAVHFPDAARIRSLSVRFLKFVEVGETASFHIEERDGQTLHGKVEVGGVDVVVIAAVVGAEPVPPQPWTVTSAGDHSSLPADLSFADASRETGSLALGPEVLELRTMYPAAAAIFGARLAGLAALSRLVGMVCPGLHSIFSGLAVDFIEDGASKNGASENSRHIRYSVSSSSERHRTIALDISGAGLTGKVRTLMRLPPMSQLSYRGLLEVVRPQEFAGSSAFVVGASRGLGELTAKIIAAGGGKVLATYAVGKSDCERVAQEIRDGGGHCEAVHFDAMAQTAPPWGDVPPRSLYYFATAQIFRRKGKEFVPEYLQSFTEMYVTAFDRLCRHFHQAAARNGAVFYPSSVAIDERFAPLLEYSMAKLCGEELCAQFSSLYPGMSVVVKRLPRLLTDQTNIVADMKQQSASAVDVLLPIIRQVEKLTGIHVIGNGSSD